MRNFRARYITVCQQFLVTAAVAAVGLSAAGVMTLQIVAPEANGPAAAPALDAPARGVVATEPVVTGGRAHPTRNIFDLVTLVIAARSELVGLSPEKRRVMELCRGGALSVAEVAGHLALPVSVTKVLLSDLVDSGHIVTRSAAPKRLPDDQVLQEVLDGLRARL